MKVSVQLRRMMGKSNLGFGVKDADITLIGYRQKEGEEEVELFRLPITGQIQDNFTMTKFYANPEGGVELGEFWMELESSDKSEFSFRYNVTLNHEPPIKATATAPDNNEGLGNDASQPFKSADSPQQGASTVKSLDQIVPRNSNDPPPAA